MSLVMRRSFNLLKYINYKPIRSFSEYPIIKSNVNSLISRRNNLSNNNIIAIRNLSSKTTEFSNFSEEFNENNQNCDHFHENTETMEPMEPMDIYSTKTSEDDNMTNINNFWTKHEIKVHGKDAPLPILDMNGYDWPESIQQALEADRFDAPTPIQCQGWPIVLSGRDMVGVAQTGSGKTLCYVLPAFVKIVKEGTQRGPKCLILAPTRELAQQIQSVVRRYKFANNVCLFGGASRMPQMQILREQNPQIIIATPGRMIDFVESGSVDLSKVDYLVLDEADRMLDMGFEPQIRKIIETIPSERQTVMWSATWPKEVKLLAAQYMRDYIQINVGGSELSANKNIEQVVEVCDEFEKKPKLFDLLNKIRSDLNENKTLIFAKTKQSVDYLTNEMRSNGWPATCIHGDKSQMVRDRTLTDFRIGRYPILVATDVAARGLDVDDIKYVINYDYPNSSEDYVHRIGRTGRLDRKGTAFTFMSATDARQANELIDLMRESNQAISPQLLQLAEMSKSMNDSKKRPRYGTPGSYGNSSSYGSRSYGNNGSYQNRVYNNNGYQRNSNYNKYDGQRRPNYQSDSNNEGSGGYRSYNRQSARPTDDSNYNSNYGNGRGPPFRGY